MRRLLPSIGAVLALLATAPASPFYLPNEHPVTRLFGIPPAESGFVADGTRVFGSLNVANNSHDDLAGRETLRLDGETYVARLAVRHSFSRLWEVGLDLPYVRHAGGELDGFIESYHDTLGLPPGNRKRIPPDHLMYAFVREGQTLFHLAEEADGPGDVRLNLGRQLLVNANRSRAVAARLAVECPTGDRDNLLGSGSTDVSFSIAATDEAMLRPLRLDASLGVLAMLGGGLLEEWREPVAGFGSVTLGWPVGKRVCLKAQVDGNTPLFRDLEAGPLDEWAWQIVMGGTLLLPHDLALDLAVAEDAAVSTAPDVVFHLRLSREW